MFRRSVILTHNLIYSPHAFQKNLVARVPVKYLNGKKEQQFVSSPGTHRKVQYDLNLTLTVLCIELCTL